MTQDEFRAVVSDCKLEGYTFHVQFDRNDGFVFGTYNEADTVTGRIEEQKTREWILDLQKVTRSEVVSTVFKCALTSMEHRTREWFRYRGKAIYQPHHDVDALLQLCRTQETAHA